MPRFDPSINLGHVITICSVLVTMVGGWFTFDYRLKSIEDQVRGIPSVIVEAARMDERMADLRRRVDNLERKP